MLNKYGERTQRCRTPFLTRNHSDSVPATLTLASCFLYSFGQLRTAISVWFTLHLLYSGSYCQICIGPMPDSNTESTRHSTVSGNANQTSRCSAIPTYADNAAMPAVARRPLLQQSIVISCRPGPQQQTCSSGGRCHVVSIGLHR